MIFHGELSFVGDNFLIKLPSGELVFLVLFFERFIIFKLIQLIFFKRLDHRLVLHINILPAANLQFQFMDLFLELHLVVQQLLNLAH